MFQCTAKFKEGDVVEYDYHSGGHWKTVRAAISEIVRTGEPVYVVRILRVLSGKEHLADGSSLVGEIRYPLVVLVDARGTLVEDNSVEEATTTTSNATTSNNVQTIYSDNKVEVSGQVKNVDDLFKKTGLDPERWEVKRFTVSIRETEEEEAYQVWARLVPAENAAFKQEEWQEEFLQRVADLAPNKVKITKKDYDLVGDVNISDVHWRLLAWDKETGADYDIDIASTVVKASALELIEDLIRMGVGKIIFSSCGDLLHSADQDPITSRGKNLLDVDSRFQRAFDAAFTTFVFLIDTVTQKYNLPVDVILVPGNHDEMAVYHLTKTLSAYYRNQDSVFVDTTPKMRKYYRHGKQIVCLEHGHSTRLKSIASVVAKENSDISWDSHPFREVRLGHIHHLKVQDIDGLIVRWVSAPPAPDAWHVEKGFIGSQKGLQAFAYDSEKGIKAVLHSSIQYPIGGD